MDVLGLLLYVLFFFCLVKTIYNWIRAFILRASFKRKLTKLCSEHCYDIKTVGGFWRSLFRYTSKPDIILKTPHTKYIIRFVTCRARKRFYHFVTPQFYAKYMKLYFAMFGASKELGFRMFETSGYIPELDESYTKKSDNVQLILLFNPSPLVINCTSNGKKEEAGNGSQFSNYTIYNANGFINLLKSKD